MQQIEQNHGNPVGQSEIAPAETQSPIKIGVACPTHGRPDFARMALLQLAMQSTKPHLVCVHQNGDAHSYESLIRDIDWPFEVCWMHTPAKIAQHQWYAVPIKALLEQNCTHFFWADHDDIYHANHIQVSVSELQHYDFRISAFANLLCVDQTRYVQHRGVRFTAHAPGGMSASMAFSRKFAIGLLEDLTQDKEHYYSDNVVAKVTMPRFKCLLSSQLTTTYLAHRATHSSAHWVDQFMPPPLSM